MLGLLTFSYYKRHEGLEPGSLPGYAKRTPRVQAAYEYALHNPELLEYIPCYCNCHRLGHKSVEDCFVKSLKKGGKVVFDDHGSECGICYATVLDSKKLLQEGKSSSEIRDFVDEKYSQYGRGTVTPRPVEMNN